MGQKDNLTWDDFSHDAKENTMKMAIFASVVLPVPTYISLL